MVVKNGKRVKKRVTCTYRYNPDSGRLILHFSDQRDPEREEISGLAYFTCQSMSKFKKHRSSDDSDSIDAIMEAAVPEIISWLEENQEGERDSLIEQVEEIVETAVKLYTENKFKPAMAAYNRYTAMINNHNGDCDLAHDNYIADTTIEIHGRFTRDQLQIIVAAMKEIEKYRNAIHSAEMDYIDSASDLEITAPKERL